MKIKRKALLRIFDRAYDKAAAMKAGDPNPLKPMEEKVLRMFMHRKDK